MTTHLQHPFLAIIDAAAEEFGVTREQIIGPERTQGVVEARHAAIWVVRQLYDEEAPLHEIGEVFGDRHHTTIMHALERVDQRIRQDRRYALRVNRLCPILRGASQPRAMPSRPQVVEGRWYTPRV